MKKELVQKLYRSRQQKILAGVCGGLADYFSVDVTLIRLAFVILTIVGGSGLLIYLVLAIITPLEPSNDNHHHHLATKARRKKFFGFLVIGLGVVLLTNNLAPNIWQETTQKFFFPFLMIAFGCLLILKKTE